MPVAICNIWSPLNIKISPFNYNRGFTRAYSSNKGNNSWLSEVLNEASVVYEDAYSMKKEIIKENQGKLGIYMWKK